MFCGKCGAKNSDEAGFCASCGAKIKETVISSEVMPNIHSNKRNRKIGIIAVAGVSILLLVGIVLVFGGRSYKSVVKQYINAQYDADVEGVIKLIHKDVLEEILEEEGYDKKEFIEEGQESLEDAIEDIEYYFGEDWKMTLEIVNIENLDKDDLEDLKEEYEDIDVKIKKAKNVEIELTVKGTESETSRTTHITVVKIGRSWYLEVINGISF